MSEFLQLVARIVKGQSQTLYAHRPLLNHEEVADWAKSQGFDTTLGPKMHVTLAFSKTPVDSSKIFQQAHDVTVKNSARSVEPLGDGGAIVLRFDDPTLQAEWQALCDAGCSWDYDGFKPHITITWNKPDAVNLDTVQPYEGPLLFGPQVFEPLNEDWKSTIVEKKGEGNPYHDKKTGKFTTKEGAGRFYLEVTDKGNYKAHHANDIGMHYNKELKQWLYEGTDQPVPADVDAILRQYKTPPGWTGVRVNVDPNAHMAVLGYDKNGTRQYRYNVEFQQGQAAEKFARLKDFTQALPKIRAQVLKDLHSLDDKVRAAAQVLYLIDHTGFRVGGEKDTKAEKDAFGATTLEGRHVSFSGNTVTFSFVGKKGVDIEHTVTDTTLADMIRERVSRVGKKGKLFDTSDSYVRGYLKQISGGDFSPKDFRTYWGTALALKEVKKYEIPTSDTQLKAIQKAVSKVVSAHLHNTPKVALDSYIAPAVWKMIGEKIKKVFLAAVSKVMQLWA